MTNLELRNKLAEFDDDLEVFIKDFQNFVFTLADKSTKDDVVYEEDNKLIIELI